MTALTGATGKPIQLGIDHQGKCTVGRKCIRKDGHDGDCWPKDGDA
jgi:hypothetical protein